MNSSRPLRTYLKSLLTAGVSHIPMVNIRTPVRPTRRVAAKSAPPSRQPVARRDQPGKHSGTRLLSPGALHPDSVQVPQMLDETSEVINRPLQDADQKSQALCDLAAVVGGCRRCSELADARTQTVFGVGNADAQIMFVGEAPGADEDKQGEPFVGRAGQLLNKIIEASTLKREDLYICNILRCRPPGNRNPLPQEAANCREFLDGQIRIVQPDYIVCWGTVAAQNLLSEKRSIGKLRGQFFDYNGARVMCTYHPSYLLRNPSAKKQVWEDMKFFMKELGVTLT